MRPIAVHAFNAGPLTGSGNWTWLIPGPTPTLIDAGIGDVRHLDALDAALSGAPLAQVLVTHGHSDHASGAGAILQRMPHVRVLKMPWPARDGRWPIRWETLADGDIRPAGDTSIIAVHTPGHAPDHLCFWHAATGTLFGGDLAIEGTSVCIPASERGDLAAYLASLERVLALNPVRILPAHGPVIEEPSKLLRGYIAHRMQREAQIVDALRGGDTLVDTLLARIYPDLKAHLLTRARETLTAHLLKLERDGRASRRGDAWHIIES